MNQEIKRMMDLSQKEDDDKLDFKDNEVKKLLEKNLEMTEEVYRIIKKVNKYLVMQQVFGFLKILVIIVPIILGLIYLPPLLKDVFDQYQQLLYGASGVGEAAKNLDMDLLKDTLNLP